MTNKEEVRIVERALNRLASDGYQVVLASDGGARYKVNNVQKALEAADGSDEAYFYLEKADHHCTLFVVWGNGEDVITDYSADSGAELDRLEDIIYG
jgi:hypothetical protein